MLRTSQSLWVAEPALRRSFFAAFTGKDHSIQPVHIVRACEVSFSGDTITYLNSTARNHIVSIKLSSESNNEKAFKL